MHTYQIGGKTYRMEKMVMGQVEHLTRRLAGLDSFEMSVPSIVGVVAKRTDLLACVLLPEGTSRAELVKQLDSEDGAKATQQHLRENLEIEVLVSVVTDFFDLIPMSQLVEAIEATKGKLMKGFRLAEQSPNNLNPSMPKSPADGSEIVNSSEPLLHPSMSRPG